MTKIERFLLKELGIEFKAALYFYSMFFFYLAYKIWCGNIQGNLLVLVEMIAITYIMAWLQMVLLGNFDEAEKIDLFVIIKSICSSVVYAGISYLGNWFDRNLIVTIIYFVFMILCYGCVYWAYSFRRIVSTKEMNEELQAFKRQKQRSLISAE